MLLLGIYELLDNPPVFVMFTGHKIAKPVVDNHT